MAWGVSNFLEKKMTLDEAERLIKILSSADGGCVSCATGLMDAFVEAFPEFEYKLTGDWYKDTAVVYLTHNLGQGSLTRRIPLPWGP